MRAITLLLTPLCLFLPACDGSDGSQMSPWEGSVDTLASGTVVVQNPEQGLWDASSPWTLQRITRIGTVEGDSQETFGRIADVALAPDRQSIYVLDGQAAEVRVFDVDGNYLRTIGGSGSGPGEFESPYGLTFDSLERLWVADARNRRYSVFSPAGELLETYRSPFRGGLTSGGQLRAIRTGEIFDLARITRMEEGDDGDFQFQSLGPGALLLSVEDSLEVVDSVTFGEGPPLPTFSRVEGNTGINLVAPHAPVRRFELSDSGRVWTGTSDEYAVHEVSLSGDTVLTIGRDVPARELSGSDAASLRDWSRSLEERGFTGDDTSLPSSYPFFERIVWADDGHLWLFRDWGEGGRFDVFDSSGRYLGEIPSSLAADGLETHPHITGEYLIGAAMDSLDVPYVEVYEIVREP